MKGFAHDPKADGKAALPRTNSLPLTPTHLQHESKTSQEDGTLLRADSISSHSLGESFLWGKALSTCLPLPLWGIPKAFIWAESSGRAGARISLVGSQTILAV